MTEKERLERIAIKTFKQHWAKILSNIEKGKIDYVDKLFGYFEADTKARQKILAGRFYGVDHAKKMAALSKKEIKQNLSCYLPRAIEYALSEPLFLWDKADIFLEELVCSQYVVYSTHITEESLLLELYSEESLDSMSLTIESHPILGIDNDWYGKTLSNGFRGYHDYYILILMKSTGEAFSRTEMRWLRKSIQRNIDSEDEDDTLWCLKCYPATEEKLWIKIYELPKSDYIDGFLWEEGYRLSKVEFKEFVSQMLEYLSKEKKWIKKLSVFNNYQSMKKEELFDITNTFFRKYTKALKNSEIKAIEGLMNDITGRKDRNYHAEVYYF